MKQSLTELRGLAQSMNVRWSFSDDPAALKQKIALKQVDMLPPVPLPIVPQPEDQRLRVKPPSKVSDENTIRSMLAPFIARGLHLTIVGDQFTMKFAEKTDSGNMRQPPRVLVDCARRVMS